MSLYSRTIRTNEFSLAEFSKDPERGLQELFTDINEKIKIPITDCRQHGELLLGLDIRFKNIPHETDNPKGDTAFVLMTLTR